MYIQRTFNAFVDGASKHLTVQGVTVPNLRDQTEDVNVGLGTVDVPVGLQKLEAGFKLAARDKQAQKLVGLKPGLVKPFTFRSVNLSEVDSTQDDEVIQITGRLGIENAEWQAQNIPKDDYKIGTIKFYKHTVNGEVIHHYDLINYILIVDGVDHWAEMRRGMGL